MEDRFNNLLRLSLMKWETASCLAVVDTCWVLYILVMCYLRRNHVTSVYIAKLQAMLLGVAGKAAKTWFRVLLQASWMVTYAKQSNSTLCM